LLTRWCVVVRRDADKRRARDELRRAAYRSPAVDVGKLLKENQALVGAV